MRWPFLGVNVVLAGSFIAESVYAYTMRTRVDHRCYCEQTSVPNAGVSLEW